LQAGFLWIWKAGERARPLCGILDS